MYMWDRFDIDEIGEDFTRIKDFGFDVVRFFLMWDAFQPEPNAMDRTALQRFDAVMERIADTGLRAMPTLFCGHMSGVNWLPAWTLERETVSGRPRFRTISGGTVVDRAIGDFYGNPELLKAQVFFARRVGDWVAVFDAGRIVEQGPPRQIFDAPTTERTRDFLSHLGWHGETL